MSADFIPGSGGAGFPLRRNFFWEQTPDELAANRTKKLLKIKRLTYANGTRVKKKYKRHKKGVLKLLRFMLKLQKSIIAEMKAFVNCFSFIKKNYFHQK